MDDYRKDSLYLDFSGMPVRPKLDKVFDIISKKIILDMTKVNCIQPSMSKARVIIECKSQSYVEELVSKHSSKHTIEHNNKQYAIPLVPYDNAIEVRVSDLPSYISTDTVARHLAPYGEVTSMQEEVWKNFWPGCPTGVKIARMRVQKPIPSYVPITTHTAYISYRNQVRTCRHCVRALHIGRSCNEARKEQGIDINSRLTAAQVVQGNIPLIASSSATQPSAENTTQEMETSVIESIPNQPVDNDHDITSPSTHLPCGQLQVAGIYGSSSAINPGTNSKDPEGNTSSMADLPDFDISDDADQDEDEGMEDIAAKRHRLQNTTESKAAPFVEVKGKGKSSSKSKSNPNSRSSSKSRPKLPSSSR